MDQWWPGAGSEGGAEYPGEHKRVLLFLGECNFPGLDGGVSNTTL